MQSRGQGIFWAKKNRAKRGFDTLRLNPISFDVG